MVDSISMIRMSAFMSLVHTQALRNHGIDTAGRVHSMAPHSPETMYVCCGHIFAREEFARNCYQRRLRNAIWLEDFDPAFAPRF